MTSRFEVNPGLDAALAKMMRPHVGRIASEVADEGKRRAPGAKTWISQRDERVRRSHASHLLDGVSVPWNLRYVLPKAGHADYQGGRDLADRPGDPNLPYENREGCRCDSQPDPDAIRRCIHTTPTRLVGTRVSATVEVRFHRIVESEFPDHPDRGGGWLRGSLLEVAAKHRRVRYGT